MSLQIPPFDKQLHQPDRQSIPEPHDPDVILPLSCNIVTSVSLGSAMKYSPISDKQLVENWSMAANAVLIAVLQYVQMIMSSAQLQNSFAC